MATRDYLIRRSSDRMVPAACEDVQCEHRQFGWETIADTRTALGDMQATYIRQKSGRTFRELADGTGLVIFRFEPGQRCFQDHGTRPVAFFAGGRRHVKLADWIEDLDQHTTNLHSAVMRG